MKKLFVFSLAALLCALNVQAQVPNGGFEMWDTAQPPQPIGWYSFGWLGCYGPNSAVLKDSVPHSGAYNVKLTTQFGGFTGMPSAGTFLNGDAIPLTTCGTNFTGTPINYIPNQVTGFFTYELPQGGQDWAEITVAVMHGDTLLASGVAQLHVTTGGYAPFSVNIVADSAAPAVSPTKILIMAYSNSFYRYSMAPNAPCPYAELRLDDVAATNFPMTRPIPIETALAAYPNPAAANSDITIYYALPGAEMQYFCGTPLPNTEHSTLSGGCYGTPDTPNALLEVVDINGATVWKASLQALYGHIAVPTAGWKAGAYIGRILSDKKTIRQMRFIVQ